jgi:hypothetical protein
LKFKAKPRSLIFEKLNSTMDERVQLMEPEVSKSRPNPRVQIFALVVSGPTCVLIVLQKYGVFGTIVYFAKL